MEDTREIVLEGLLAFEKELSFSNQLISDILDKYDYLESRDKAFIKRLFEGCIERRIELDYHIDGISSVPVRKMKPLIRNLIRMGTYQILYMDNVPDSAAINEAVKSAKKHKFASLSGFVNAILRNMARRKGNLSWPDYSKNPEKYLSVRYSVPEWIVAKWIGIYEYDETEKLLRALLDIHPVSVRFRRNMDEKCIANLVKNFEEKGAVLEKDDRLGYVYRAEHLDNIREMPGFEEGDFTVQDISSCLAVEAAGIKESDSVIDVCAAPGGKSILASEITGKTGNVLSRDVSENKTDKIEENALRMKAVNLKTQVWDGCLFDENCEEKADVLILDVPCSGLGVLGKKRDIKYNATAEGQKELNILQKRIVEASWKYVKHGGKMLYSTCTINPDENENMVKWICSQFPFDVIEGPVQLLPHKDHCDGFFYTVLKRK